MVDGINVYAYTVNNPIRFVDPKGMQHSETSSPPLSSGAQQFLERHQDLLGKGKGNLWYEILPQNNTLHLVSQGENYERFMSSKGTADAAMVVTMASLGIFGIFVAAEMGAGALLVSSTSNLGAAYSKAGAWAGAHFPGLTAFTLAALQGLTGTPSPKPTVPVAGLVGKTKTWTSSLPAGVGETDKFGNMTLSSLGTAINRAQVELHEGVHSFLSPEQSGVINTIRADILDSGYKNSHLLKFTEEALAETVAQVGTRNMSGQSLLQAVGKGYRYPLNANYGLSRLQIGLEGAGLVGTLGGLWYGAYRSTEKLLSQDNSSPTD
jgi:hypothetical protein